jgi:hypothetical protein
LIQFVSPKKDKKFKEYFYLRISPCNFCCTIPPATACFNQNFNTVMKKTLTILSFLVVLFVASESCSTAKVMTGRAAGIAYPDSPLHRWFWGYVANSKYVTNSCKAIQSVQIKTKFWQGAITVLSLGIYCPVTIHFECAVAPAPVVCPVCPPVPAPVKDTTTKNH